MLIGYARVSTQDQSLELQRQALSQAGCQKVLEDHVSGAQTERPGLAKAREMLREGDTLVVWKLDRLCRKGGAKTEDDREQNQVGKKATGQRHRSQGGGSQPRCLGSDTVPLAARL